MQVNEYQAAALRTLNPNLSNKELLIDGALGLCGESGECADIVKKYLAQGHVLDKEKLIKELGDVAWYLAITAEALEVSLESVFQQNIDKLTARYPTGFDKNRSKFRAPNDV